MSIRLPAIAPMLISSRATDTANQACSEAAVSARPIHSADANQMLSIPNLSSARSGGSPQIQAPGGQNKTRQAAGYGPAACGYAAGVISPCGRLQGNSIPLGHNLVYSLLPSTPLRRCRQTAVGCRQFGMMAPIYSSG